MSGTKSYPELVVADDTTGPWGNTSPAATSVKSTGRMAGGSTAARAREEVAEGGAVTVGGVMLPGR